MLKIWKRIRWEGRVFCVGVISVGIFVSLFVWIQNIHTEAEKLRIDPAMRIVQSCEKRNKMVIFVDYVEKDGQLVLCE